MTSVAIVQARMASTRLPGKVLRILNGLTVLEHVLTRCKAIDGIDSVWCAVSEEPGSDRVAQVAEKAGFPVFRGSEADVLRRYRDASRASGADVVLRVTSDCPLIDPDVCAAVLELRESSRADYASNNLHRSWPHGLDCEAFVVPWLERADREATSQYEREHVTPYIRNHPEANRVNLSGPGGAAAKKRWTLDTPADWVYIEAIFAHLPAHREAWDWHSVMHVLDEHPELEALEPASSPG